MNDDLQTAILFTANFIESRNVIFLAPQKIIIGECSDDTSYFYSYLDCEEYENADDAVRDKKYIGFYDVITISRLKEIYESDDLEEVFQKYINDIYTKVYYYELTDENSFEDYFMKRCSIEEFNNKFDLNFAYDHQDYDYDDYEEEEELDPLTTNFRNIKNALDKNILFQNKAKDKLINTLYNNCISNEIKSNIIISGPSGVGKTAMLKLLADTSSYPVLYTKYTPELIDDPEEYLNNLLIQAYYVGLSKDNKERFIIAIDDFDKEIDYCKNMDVLDSFAKFFQNGKRFVPYQPGSKQGLIFNPDFATFIISGNFNNVKKETVVPSEFFLGQDICFDDIPETLDRQELMDSYGFSKETLDSFSTHIDFQPLTLDKTKKILINSNNSLFNIYCRRLKEQGIKVNITDETIDLICKKVYSETNNIKNINTVISNVFKDIMLETLTLDERAEITISEETVKNHKKYILKKVQKNS